MMLYDKAYWFEQDQEANLPQDYYSSKLFVDKAIDYIATNDKDKKPFFAYIGFQANIFRCKHHPNSSKNTVAATTRAGSPCAKRGVTAQRLWA